MRFPMHEEGGGLLGVYEGGKGVPFDIKRVFTVQSPNGLSRGDHAHRQCTQLLVCVNGAIKVSCDDGSSVSEHLLDSMGSGLLIPPGVWSKQEYLSGGSTLMVLCDRGYEAEDYIRDYADFKTYCSTGK